MNRFFYGVALGLMVGGAAHAAVVDLSPTLSSTLNSTPHVRPLLADLAPTPLTGVVAPPARMSELPEPEVFAMLLVGLVLLGYRARRRDSSEKFK